MKYKLIALDMDATLLNKDKIITENTETALIKAQQKGVKVAIASGRMPFGVAKYAKDQAKDEARKARVVIGGDTRVATRESLPLIKDTLLGQNVDVMYIEKPVPTPLLALAAREYDVQSGLAQITSGLPNSRRICSAVTVMISA